MYSTKNQCQNIVFSHVSMITKIVLFFENVGKGCKENRERKQKFYELRIVFNNLEGSERNGDRISGNKKNQEYYNSFPVFYGENSK